MTKSRCTLGDRVLHVSSQCLHVVISKQSMPNVTNDWQIAFRKRLDHLLQWCLKLCNTLQYTSMCNAYDHIMSATIECQARAGLEGHMQAG